MARRGPAASTASRRRAHEEDAIDDATSTASRAQRHGPKPDASSWPDMSAHAASRNATPLSPAVATNGSNNSNNAYAAPRARDLGVCVRCDR